MLASVFIVMGSLILIVTVIVFNGAPSLSIEIFTQTSEGGFYLGAGGSLFGKPRYRPVSSKRFFKSQHRKFHPHLP